MMFPVIRHPSNIHMHFIIHLKQEPILNRLVIRNGYETKPNYKLTCVDKSRSSTA